MSLITTQNNFYRLPNIHKDRPNPTREQNSEVGSINELQDLKVRSIVRGLKCSTRKLGKLIDTLLKPFLKHVKSYIRKDRNVKNMNVSRVIATFDIVGFYTKMPHTCRMETVRYFLWKYKENIPPMFNKYNFYFRLNWFYIKNNTCVFYNQYFLQLQGTGKGTMLAPTYANLSMGYHDIKLYDLIELNYDLYIRY